MTRDATDLLRATLPRLRAAWPIRFLGLYGAPAQTGLVVLVEFERPVSTSAYLALGARMSKIIGLAVHLLPTAGMKPNVRAMLSIKALQLWPPRRSKKSLLFVNKKKQKNFIQFR